MKIDKAKLEQELMNGGPLSNHDWVQRGENMNGGNHVWQCLKCGEWTRSHRKPSPNAKLIDPDNGEYYSSNKCREESVWPKYDPPMEVKSHRLYTGKYVYELIRDNPYLTIDLIAKAHYRSLIWVYDCYSEYKKTIDNQKG